ncbi:AraC family transcriptional regulator [Paraflavitalea pollutisoli]|uniref:AraC family transcriptional regulator n=1 Tax=Paraflavitalea pollutisoli TaxID=3034143 RepID=UPI0023EB219A|nr:helix-turn-helix transcriptional regulator [Paraflavitalea sp. H1-2-19X]
MYYQAVAPTPTNILPACTIARLTTSGSTDHQPFSQVTGPQQYTLLWIQEGNGQISLDTDRLTIYPQHIYCLRPGQRVQVTHSDMEGWQLTFRKEFLDLVDKGASSFVHGVLLHHFCGRPAIQLSPTLVPLLDSLISQMQQEQHGQDVLRQEVVRNLLRLFIIYLCRHCDTMPPLPENTRRADMVTHFFQLVEQHFVTHKKVNEYASLLGITPNYLNAIVREHSGFSPSYHIQQRIVLEAKRQALYERDSMKEIAYALGFCNPAHFSKYFKSTTGINFTTFKRSA